MNISIFGIGYVGLVQAAVMADAGHHILCIDSDSEKITKLKQGIIPIHEHNLSKLVRKNYANKRLKFTTKATESLKHSSIQFIAVGTPNLPKNNTTDLSFVFSVARKIATYMESDQVIIVKSTVPVGTADELRNIIAQILKQRRVTYNFDVVSNPEFLKEGEAIIDCAQPERIIIGTGNEQVKTLMLELYAPFINHKNVFFMDSRSAELTKYAANAMLATKISFINEIAHLSQMLGADIEQVRRGIAADSRIGYHFINPGCGYGGSCFPKDVQSLIAVANSVGYSPKLLTAVEEINTHQKQILFKQLQWHFKKHKQDLHGKVFAIWGASFKPNTNDIRHAPSLTLMQELWKVGAIVQLFDPYAMPEITNHYGKRKDLLCMPSKEAAVCNSEALLICTEWQIFKNPDFNFLKQALRQPLIFDGRNLYDPNYLTSLGFVYYSIGRSMSHQ